MLPSLVQLKHCYSCATSKPLSEFHKSKAHTFGVTTKCKVCAIAFGKRWRVANPEKIKAHTASRPPLTDEQKRKMSIIGLRCRLAKPAQYKAMQAAGNHGRRAEKWGVMSDLTGEQWLSVLEEYGHKCLRCGRSDEKLTIDHIVPFSLGGPNTQSNIQPLCTTCNHKKHLSTIDYRKGLHCLTTRQKSYTNRQA